MILPDLSVWTSVVSFCLLSSSASPLLHHVCLSFLSLKLLCLHKLSLYLSLKPSRKAREKTKKDKKRRALSLLLSSSSCCCSSSEERNTTRDKKRKRTNLSSIYQSFFLFSVAPSLSQTQGRDIRSAYLSIYLLG